MDVKVSSYPVNIPINVIEIEGLLFPGFGETQALHGKPVFPSSDVTKMLKMELFN